MPRAASIRTRRSSGAAPDAGVPCSADLLGLLDALVVGLRAVGGVRLEECLRVVGRCEARLAAVRAAKIDELARWRGEAHAAEVLRGDLKQSRGGAKREVQFAERLADLPGTAEALADGVITPQHARAIAAAAAHTPVDEAELLDAAEKEPADVFGHTVREHVNERSAGKPQGTNLLVIANYDLVAGQLRDARLVDGTPLAPSELLKIALDANILPALFDTKGQPLWLGHKYRHATVAQRIALAVRDGGCAVCGASNSFCQAHHVIWWEHGGPTDIDNLVLLCSDCHHKQIHELGAELVRDPDGKVHLEIPSNRPPPGSRNGNARNGKAHNKSRGPSGRRTGAIGAVNQPLRR